MPCIGFCLALYSRDFHCRLGDFYFCAMLEKPWSNSEINNGPQIKRELRNILTRCATISLCDSDVTVEYSEAKYSMRWWTKYQALHHVYPNEL